jgi:hypothetical protein
LPIVDCGLTVAGWSFTINPQSAIRNPQSAIRNPQSAIRNHQPSDIFVALFLASYIVVSCCVRSAR